MSLSAEELRLKEDHSRECRRLTCRELKHVHHLREWNVSLARDVRAFKGLGPEEKSTGDEDAELHRAADGEAVHLLLKVRAANEMDVIEAFEDQAAAGSAWPYRVSALTVLGQVPIRLFQFLCVHLRNLDYMDLVKAAGVTSRSVVPAIQACRCLHELHLSMWGASRKCGGDGVMSVAAALARDGDSTLLHLELFDCDAEPDQTDEAEGFASLFLLPRLSQLAFHHLSDASGVPKNVHRHWALAKRWNQHTSSWDEDLAFVHDADPIAGLRPSYSLFVTRVTASANNWPAEDVTSCANATHALAALHMSRFASAEDRRWTYRNLETARASAVQHAAASGMAHYKAAAGHDAGHRAASRA